MGYNTFVVCGLIASPGDTQKARDLMPSVFRNWNTAHAEAEEITLRSLLWEKDAVPNLGTTAQSEINKQLLSKADFLIAFFNTRVGTPTEKEISGTVEEIKEFEALRKPVLLYFEGSQIDRKVATSDQFRKLADLKQEYSTKGLVGNYTNISELESQVSKHLSSVVRAIKISLEKQRQEKRAESAAIQVAVERNPFLKKIVTRLNMFETLTDRCANRNPDLKQKIAAFFWRHFHGEVFNKEVRNIFFESGSTIVYLADEFIAHCNSRHLVLDGWTIKTNNILTYLSFVLFERVDIVLSPYGPPDNAYGATFGPLQLPNVDPPDSSQEVFLEQKIRSAIDKQASELLPLGTPSLILATASGLELDEKHRYPGLHVGSFQNMLFKRAILKSLHPAVIFLDEDKISLISERGKFEFDKCYPVFDHLKAWQSVLSSAPLAFCIGFRSTENLSKVKAYFDRFGFKERAREDNTLFIRNGAWDSVFGKRVDIRI